MHPKASEGTEIKRIKHDVRRNLFKYLKRYDAKCDILYMMSAFFIQPGGIFLLLLFFCIKANNSYTKKGIIFKISIK